MVSETTEVAAPAPGRNVKVRALKFDGQLHREWQARFVAQAGSRIIVEGVFEEEIRHPQLGLIAPGTHSTEYYWTDRWYSVFRFQEPSGTLRNYYCNINLPAKFDGGLLTFVDLDIDLLVAPDFSRRVLDEDEFAANAARYLYPASVREMVPRALAELNEIIERRDDPFDWRA
jgi:protein associated with RNAse G/E